MTQSSSLRQLTRTLAVRSCYVKDAHEEVNQLRDEPPRQRHVVQEHAAHEQTLHRVLEGQDGALAEERGSVTVGTRFRHHTGRTSCCWGSCVLELANAEGVLPRGTPGAGSAWRRGHSWVDTKMPPGGGGGHSERSRCARSRDGALWAFVSQREQNPSLTRGLPH